MPRGPEEVSRIKMGFKARPKRVPQCSVRKGQTYRVDRIGKPYIHVKIVGVRGANGHQPKATYRKVRRTTGKFVGPRAELPSTHWLRWTGHTWIMGGAFTLVE